MSDSWMQEFQLNTMQVSNLSAAFFYTYVLMQIPVGVLYDRYSAKKILIIAAVTLSLGCLMLALTHNYHMAIIARFLMGIGSSFGYIGMLKVVLNNFTPNKFALMLGIGETIAMTIVTLGVIALGYFLKLHSWRIAMFISCVFAAIITGAIIYYMEDNTNKSKPIPFIETLSQVRVLLLDKQVLLCSLYGFFMFAIINAFTSLWGVNFITHTYTYSPETAANMVSVVFVGLGIGAPLNGLLSKKYNSHTKLMMYCAISISIVTTLIIIVPGLPKSFLYILLFLSGLFCSGYVQCLSVIKDSVNINTQATALATSNMIIMAGAPILQLFIGSLLNTNIFGHQSALSYRFSLSVIPIGMIIAILLCKYIKEPHKHVIIKEF